MGKKYEIVHRLNFFDLTTESCFFRVLERAGKEIYLHSIIMTSTSAQEGSGPSNSSQDTETITAVGKAEAMLGRQLETGEQEFIKEQLELHAILRVKCNLRSEREKERIKVLQIHIRNTRRKYNNPHLNIQKMPVKSGMNRTRKWRGKKEEDEVEEQVTNELRVRTVDAAAAVYGFEEVVAFLLNSKEEPEN